MSVCRHLYSLYIDKSNGLRYCIMYVLYVYVRYCTCILLLVYMHNCTYNTCTTCTIYQYTCTNYICKVLYEVIILIRLVLTRGLLHLHRWTAQSGLVCQFWSPGCVQEKLHECVSARSTCHFYTQLLSVCSTHVSLLNSRQSAQLMSACD